MKMLSSALVFSLVTLIGTATSAQSPPVHSPHEQVVLSYFRDVLDGRQIALVDKLFLPNCVIHRPEGTLDGLPGIRGVVQRNIAAYSTFATEVHDIFESRDRVVVRLTHRAMGSGEFRSRIGTHDIKGKAVVWGAIVIVRMKDDKIAEQWVSRDELGMLSSFGILRSSSGN